MKNVLFLFMLLPIVCHAQKVTQTNEGAIRIEGDTILYFDAEGFSITERAHSDSLKTHKYIISIIGTDEKPEIHLVYKYPKLETLMGKTLPLCDFSDINDKPVKIDEKDITVISFWDKHCSICIRELTVLDILAEDYSNVGFIALTPDSREEVQHLIKRLHLNWENIIVVPNYDGEFQDTLRINVYPANVIVDKNRVIKGVTVGGNIRKLLRTLEKISDEN